MIFKRKNRKMVKLVFRTSREYGRGKYNDVIPLCHQMLEIEPTDKYALNTIAECYARIGDVEKAIEGFNKIIKIEPDDFRALRWLSDLHQKRDEHDEAYEYAVRALSNIKEDETPKIDIIFLKIMNLIPKFKGIYNKAMDDFKNADESREVWIEYAKKYIKWYQDKKSVTIH